MNAAFATRLMLTLLSLALVACERGPTANGIDVTVALERASDRELETWAAEQRKPLIIIDEFFGRLELDRSLSSYEGRRTTGTTTYRVAIDVKDQTPLEQNRARIAASREMIRRFESNLARFIDASADKLHPLYNDEWRNEDEEPELTRAQFVARLKLTDVHLTEHGEIFAYLDAGELFSGHIVELRLDSPDELTSIGLAG